MNKAIRSFLAILMAVTACQIFAAEPRRNLGVAATTEKRVALVIGNGKYAGSPLRNPVNDARDMAAALRRIGFEVIEKTDVTQKEMNRAITQFGSRLTTDTVALFFYAGHGMQVKGKNYLIPIDAQIENEASVRAETVDVDAVLDQLSASPLNVVILDACRNNPFERRFRGTGGGLAQMDAPKGTLIAYATSPGKVASDGDGRNGIYTQELLKIIQTPGLPVEQAFKRVRANVARSTGDNQIPWEASSLTGDFFFTRGRTEVVIESAAQSPMSVRTAAQIEQDFWNRVRDSQDIMDFQDYLQQYPQGSFAAEARLMVRRLGVPQQLASATSTSAPPPPAQAWFGVSIQAVTPELAKAFGLSNTQGALVADLAPDSPAAQAGIVPGDVIVTFQGTSITAVADLPKLVAATPAGTQVSLQAVHNGRMKTYATVLVKPPQAATFRPEGAESRGVMLSQLDTTQQQKLAALGLDLKQDDRIIGLVDRGGVVETDLPVSFASRLDAIDKAGGIALQVQRGTARVFVFPAPRAASQASKH